MDTLRRVLHRDDVALALVATAAMGVYGNSLWGKYAYDDKVAVIGNPDVVRSDRPWSALLWHDFWGNELLSTRQHGWTHHSWRPLVVATFKLNWMMGGGDVTVFHATNLVIHAASCMLAYITLRCMMPAGSEGRRLPLLAALAFALHPIHTECVANITSRADTLASVFQLAALAVYARFLSAASAGWRPGAPTPQLPQVHDSFLQSLAAYAQHIWVGAPAWAAMLLLGLLAMACKETTLMLPVLCACMDIAAAIVTAAWRTSTALAHGGESTVDDSSRARVPAVAPSPPPASSPRSTSTKKVSWKLTTPAGKQLAPKVEVDAPPLPVSWRARAAQVARNGYTHLATAGGLLFNFMVAMPWARFFFLMLLAAASYYVRVVVMARGYALHTWANPLHNKLYHIEDVTSRLLSIIYVQCMAMSALVVPVHLSHEHNAIRVIASASDPRLLLVLFVWYVLILVATATLSMLVRVMRGRAGANVPAEEEASRSHTAERLFRVLFGTAFVALSYFPSSHAVQYVAFVMAERTLYVPSFGACLLLAELCMWLCSNDRGKTVSAASSHTRQRASAAIFALLLTYYAARTWVRNYDWADEDAVMASNLRIYPTDNPMTIYGMGAVALYRGDIPAAETYLKRAINESTMVEPYILLSQLYWKHHEHEDGGLEKAQRILELVAGTTSPRKEVLTNLGLLMMRTGKGTATAPSQAENATEWRRSYEYYILAAHVAHGYPDGHHGIALLASNAGCIRLLSPMHLYGNAALSEQAFIQAMDLSVRGGTLAAFRNAAVMYAVQGELNTALAVAERGRVFIQDALAADITHADAGRGTPQHSARLQVVIHTQEALNAIHRLQALLVVRGPLIRRFHEQGLVVGAAAEERLAALGLECFLEMLWW